tara:strand:- start:82 stop:2523 length:2442 start_codon:yes stop_codon:yes gene_type:complete
MRYIIIVLSLFIITCGGGGGGGPTEPSQPTNPTVQNINVATNEDSPIAVDLVGSDPQNLALTFSIVEQPSNGTFSYSGSAGTYTPNANYNGTDTFTYVATNGTRTSNIATVSIVINPVDDNPNTMDVSATTDEDNAIDITLSAEEFDGDSIQFNVKDNPTNGTVSIGGPFNNQATYTPNADWYGTDTFTFEAVDVNGKKILNTATATITVNPINDGPQSNDVSATTDEDVEVTISLDASDVEGDSFNYSIVSDVSHGSTTLENGVVTYTSNTDWSGTDTFTYKANDGTDDGNTATVTITVNNLPPLQGDLSQSTWNESNHSFDFVWDDVIEFNPLTDKKYGLYESESSDMSSKTLIWEGNDTNFSWVIDDGIVRYYTLGVRDIYGAESESNIAAMRSSNSRFLYDFHDNAYEEKTRAIIYNPNNDNLISLGRAKDHNDNGSSTVEYYFLETNQDGSVISYNEDDSYYNQVLEGYDRPIFTSTGDLIILESQSQNTNQQMLKNFSSDGSLNWTINIKDQIPSSDNIRFSLADAVETNDGFVLLARTVDDASTTDTNYYIFLVKTDTNGNVQYYEKFYNDGLGYYHWYTKLRLFQKGYDLNSDTYYVYGTTNRSNFDNHSKGFIGKVTDTGSTFTMGTIANIDLGTGLVNFYEIREHSSTDNTFNFYLSATNSHSTGTFIAKYSEENNVYQEHWNYPLNVMGSSTIVMTSPNTPSDHIYATQSIDNPTPGNHGYLIYTVKIDESGTALWNRTIQLQESNGVTSADLTTSATYIEGGEFAGGVAVAGYSLKNPSNDNKDIDAFIVIFDSNGASRTW